MAPRRPLAGIRSAPLKLAQRMQAAAVEEQAAAVPEEQPTASMAAAAEAAAEEAALAERYHLDELDEAQEDLLKWMLFLDDAEQEEDLDEMIDYDEFGDEEYEEIFEEVETMMEAADYELKPGDKVVGTVYECDEDGAYVEIGAKSAGFVPLSECSLARLKSVGGGSARMGRPAAACIARPAHPRICAARQLHWACHGGSMHASTSAPLMGCSSCTGAPRACCPLHPPALCMASDPPPPAPPAPPSAAPGGAPTRHAAGVCRGGAGG